MRRRRPASWDLDLQALVRAVAAEYAAFLRDAAADPKPFGARQAAAKLGLAHLEAVMKLAEGGDAGAADKVAEQLREMREAMAKDADRDDEGDPG